jgi:small subunit ribosomal protein S6
MAENRQYEIVYIMTPAASEQELADVQAQIDSAVQRYGATLEKTDNWGRRKLAYEIGGHKEGTYVLQVLSGPGEMVKEIERRLRVFDTVLRYLAVRVDDDLRIAERAQADRKAETARRRVARGLPPEVEPSSMPAGDESDRDREEAEV